MEPVDPISQLAMCCFGRRQRSDGFKTQALRKQYYYSPSMAQIGPGSTATWPVGPYTPTPVGLFAASPVPPVPQPYIFYTTPPLIITRNQNAQAQVSQSGTSLALVQAGQSPGGQLQAISLVNAQPSPMHKLQSLIGPSQYAIYSSSIADPAADMLIQQQQHQTYPTALRESTIYESPKFVTNRLVRNSSNYLEPITESSFQSGSQQNLASRARDQLQGRQNPNKSLNQTQRPRCLTSDIYKRLELIEKQVDLTNDMDLVERHGFVITRAIEAQSLMPHLTEETLLRYEEQFLLSDEYVIRFIEIIKRPGQTLGLYIRLVHFENQLTKVMREGIVITKIESNSPVYTSQVLHVGDEILSINLIDIQNMSLDDVVTLMSIPKRLVLALRMPKERDPQLNQTLTASNQNEMGIMIEPGLRLDLDRSQQSRERPPLGQYLQQVAPTMAIEAARPNQLIHDFGVPVMKPASQSASQSNLWMVTGSRPGYQASNIHSSLNDQLSRPVRVRSALHTNDNSDTDDKADILELQSLMEGARENLSKQGQAIGNNFKPIGQIAQGNPLYNATKESQQNRTTVVAAMSHLERQMATALSMEEHRDGSHRFRNFSVDPEIANLERDAMNKERHTMHVMSAMDGHRISYDDNTEENVDDGLFLDQFSSNHTSNTAPRRTLPNRPVSQTNPPDNALDSVSKTRRPVINNIRLGETPEQSSYFSSSIDAINRELKELRQQRMSLSNTDSVG